MKENLIYVFLVFAFFILPLILAMWMMGGFSRQSGLFSKHNPHPKPKKKFHFSFCPWCKSKIELNKTPKKVFRCPVCECEFQHNYQKWLIAIPLVLIVGIVLLCLVKFIPPIVLVWVSLIAAVIATRTLPDYKISQLGKNPPPEPQLSKAFEDYALYQQSRHVSLRNRKHFITIILIIIFALIMTILLAHC
jgi:uncharacterized protein (DUF983 family)